MGLVGVEGICGCGSSKQLKVISRREGGSWKRVTVSGSHKDKRCLRKSWLDKFTLKLFKIIFLIGF